MAGEDGILRRLLVAIGFSVDEESKKKAEESVVGVAKAMQGLAAGLVGERVYRFFEGLVEGAIEAGSELQDTSERLGIAKDSLQAFQYAAAQTGASTSEATNGLRVFSKLIQDAATGSKEAGANFAGMGVAVTDGAGKARPALDVMHDVADAFSNLEDGPEKAEKAMALFGRAGLAMVPMLSKGSDGMNALYEEAYKLGGIVDDDVINALDDAGDELVRLHASMNAVKLTIGGALAPYVQHFSEILRNDLIPRLRYLIDHTNILKYAVGLAGAATGAAFAKMALEGAKFLGLVNGEMGMGGFLKSLIKLGPTVAIIAALALAFEDVYTWVNGGNSVIGKLFENFLGAKEAGALADDLRNAFKGIGEALTTLGPPFAEFLGGLARMVVELLPSLVKGFEFFLHLLTAALEGITGFGKILGGIASGKSMDQIGAIADEAWAKISKAGLGASKVLVEAVNGKLPAQDAAAAGASAVPPGGAKIEQTNTINVTTTSNTPVAVGTAVKGALGDVNAATAAAMGG